MKCPIDDVDLAITERQGIEIDYCPKCRGVWLDRGELDKIIERSEREEPGYDEDRDRYRRDHDEGRGRYDDRDRRDRPEHHGKRKRKHSFLSEIFEFGE